MKAKIAVAVLALMVLGAFSVMAQETHESTVIHGQVLLPDNSGVGAGFDVEVTCNNETMTVQTDSNSEYQAEFNATVCAIGDTASAEVPGDLNSAVVQDEELFMGTLIVQLNLQVPEFSTIAASVAFAGAGAGLMLLRKRK